MRSWCFLEADKCLLFSGNRGVREFLQVSDLVSAFCLSIYLISVANVRLHLIVMIFDLNYWVDLWFLTGSDFTVHLRMSLQMLSL